MERCLALDHVYVEFVLHAGFEFITHGAIQADEDVFFLHLEQVNRCRLYRFIEADKEIMIAEIGCGRPVHLVFCKVLNVFDLACKRKTFKQ